MPAVQLERLRNDIIELDSFIEKLKSRGSVDRVNKLLKKKLFLEERLASI
jgi:hypothetical protein